MSPSAQPDPSPSEGPTHALIAQTASVQPHEVDLLDQLSIEILVQWGTTVLSVFHLSPPRAFYVGETQSPTLKCDYFIPSQRLGHDHIPLVLSSSSGPQLMVPAAATGFVELSGQDWLGLDDLRKVAKDGEGHAPLSLDHPGFVRVPLTLGTRARLSLGGFVFHVAMVNAGKPSARVLLGSEDRHVPIYFGASSLIVGALAAFMAFFVPSLGYTNEQELSLDRLYLMQSYLEAAAEREREAQPPTAGGSAEDEGGSGERARGEEGQMGKPTTNFRRGRFAVKGNRDNPDPHVARSALLDEVRDFGLIGILRSAYAGDPDAPTSPFGRDDALGVDHVSALSNLWGDDIHDSFGAGLGLTGTGQSGGGPGTGIAVGDIGGLASDSGLGMRQGLGNSAGRMGGGHQVTAPRVRVGQTTVSGRLPPEVIQRIVRQNYGRFRLCYEQGLTRNPNLEGRVMTRFAIARDGSVASASNAGSDLADSAVVGCVVSAFYGLSFPTPEGGIVTVAYPILFSPG